MLPVAKQEVVDDYTQSTIITNADDNSLTYSVGLMFRPSDAWSLGLVYTKGAEFKIDTQISGVYNAGCHNATALNAACIALGVPGSDGSFDFSQRETTAINLPDLLTFGVAWRPSDTWLISFDAKRIGYGSGPQVRQFTQGYGLDLNDTINVEKSSTRLIVTAENVTAVRMRELQAQSETWLRENTPETMWTIPASTNLMFSHISERNIKSSILGAFIALGLIAIILAIAFRSVKFGLISIIPNLAPALMAFGIWGLAVGKIDVGNAIVLTMALGIIVDDSVHFLSKYLRARREGGMPPEEAVRYAFSTVGAALVVTSFILVAGFMVLTLSPFGLNAGMGMLTAIVLLVALGADLLFLPPLLMRIEGEGK